MFDINKISLMYLVVVVIYFLAARARWTRPARPAQQVSRERCTDIFINPSGN